MKSIDQNKVVNNFKLNNMKCLFVENSEELLVELDQLLTNRPSTGSGDSITLEDLGIFEYLRTKTDFNDKHQNGLTKEMKRKIYLKNFDVDFFFTGANAITEDGKIFNIDGNGSRVAPLIYGPKKVIVIVGKNKLVKNEQEAIERTRQIAAVKDAKRLNKATPCTFINRCVDCKHDERICNSFVLIAHQFDCERITVIVIDEDLGY